MGYKLVVLDLDGTVVKSDGSISPRTRAAVRAARAAGMLVLAATGRRLRVALPAVRELGLEGPGIFCNGALTVDLTNWRTLACQPLGAAGIAAAARWQRAGLAPLACQHVLRGPDLLYQVPVDRPPEWLQAAELAGELGYTDDVRASAAAAMKLMTIGRPAVLQAMADDGGLPGQVMLTEERDGSALLELWREGVNKAAALRTLAAAAGIDRREIVAFGDNTNDVEMLAYAGLGVAMGNAVPAARAAAQEICAPCAEDGVAAVLEALVRPLRAVG